MSVLAGSQLRGRGIITPYHPRTEVIYTDIYGHCRLSYGESFCGYDVRVEFDPLGKIEAVILKPGEFKLASTFERFKMPVFLCAEVKDKSSWARRGLSVQNTIIEPGWEGYLTLELHNMTRRAMHIQRGAPIAQVIFQEITGWSESDHYNGKYQDQPRGPQEAK